MIRRQSKRGRNRRTISAAARPVAADAMFTFPQPSTSSTLVLTFDQPVVLQPGPGGSTAPTWAVSDGADDRTVSSMAQNAPNEVTCTLSGTVDGATTINVQQFGPLIRTQRGGFAAAGITTSTAP